MTVNIGTRHCRSDAVTLSSPSPPPQRPRLLGDQPWSVSALAPAPTRRPSVSAVFLPDSFLSSAFPRVSPPRPTPCPDRPGALVFPGSLERLLVFSLSRLAALSPCRPLAQNPCRSREGGGSGVEGWLLAYPGPFSTEGGAWSCFLYFSIEV